MAGTALGCAAHVLPSRTLASPRTTDGVAPHGTGSTPPFCASCGNDLEVGHLEGGSVCPSCGQEAYGGAGEPVTTDEAGSARSLAVCAAPTTDDRRPTTPTTPRWLSLSSPSLRWSWGSLRPWPCSVMTTLKTRSSSRWGRAAWSALRSLCSVAILCGRRICFAHAPVFPCIHQSAATRPAGRGPGTRTFS